MSTARDPAAQSSPILIIACGALAQEIVQLQTLNGWNHLHLKCLDAELHNRPHLIAGKLREKSLSIAISMKISLSPMQTAAVVET